MKTWLLLFVMFAAATASAQTYVNPSLSAQSGVVSPSNGSYLITVICYHDDLSVTPRFEKASMSGPWDAGTIKIAPSVPIYSKSRYYIIKQGWGPAISTATTDSYTFTNVIRHVWSYESGTTPTTPSTGDTATATGGSPPSTPPAGSTTGGSTGDGGTTTSGGTTAGSTTGGSTGDGGTTTSGGTTAGSTTGGSTGDGGTTGGSTTGGSTGGGGETGGGTGSGSTMYQVTLTLPARPEQTQWKVTMTANDGQVMSELINVAAGESRSVLLRWDKPFTVTTSVWNWVDGIPVQEAGPGGASSPIGTTGTPPSTPSVVQQPTTTTPGTTTTTLTPNPRGSVGDTVKLDEGQLLDVRQELSNIRAAINNGTNVAHNDAQDLKDALTGDDGDGGGTIGNVTVAGPTLSEGTGSVQGWMASVSGSISGIRAKLSTLATKLNLGVTSAQGELVWDIPAKVGSATGDVRINLAPYYPLIAVVRFLVLAIVTWWFIQEAMKTIREAVS